jgi:hypothetical protein
VPSLPALSTLCHREGAEAPLSPLNFSAQLLLPVACLLGHYHSQERCRWPCSQFGVKHLHRDVTVGLGVLGVMWARLRWVPFKKSISVLLYSTSARADVTYSGDSSQLNGAQLSHLGIGKDIVLEQGLTLWCVLPTCGE